MKVSTGGKAHELKKYLSRFGEIPKPTVKVWIKEENRYMYKHILTLGFENYFQSFFYLERNFNGRNIYEKSDRACKTSAYGHTSPNPVVGCVVVKNNQIIAEGYHEHYSGYHAERNALLNAKEDVMGADMYVTLEPCSHFGKTPPCTDIIIEKKIKRVIIGSLDPNPKVSGIAKLKENGIEVITGVCEKECLDLNEIFFHYIKTNTPFVSLKYAMTLDRKNRNIYGRFKVGYRRNNKKPCATFKKKIFRDFSSE